MLQSLAGRVTLVGVFLLPHVKFNESRFVQPLPHRHLHTHVMVDEEGHLVIVFIVVVVRVVSVVRRHEAVCADL